MSKRYLPVFPGQLFQAILQYIIKDLKSVVATQLYYLKPPLILVPNLLMVATIITTKQGIFDQIYYLCVMDLAG